MRSTRNLPASPFAHAPGCALALALALCATGTARAADGDLIDIAWSASGTFERDVRIAAKRFVEVCGKLPAGAAIQWRFEAAAPLDFNIHFHEGNDVRYPARQAGVAKAEGKLEAKVAQDYCWMWTNKSAAEVRLTFALRKP